VSGPPSPSSFLFLLLSHHKPHSFPPFLSRVYVCVFLIGFFFMDDSKLMPNDLFWTLAGVAASAGIGNTVASVFRVPYEVVKQRLQAGVYDSTAQVLLLLLLLPLLLLLLLLLHLRTTPLYATITTITTTTLPTLPD